MFKKKKKSFLVLNFKSAVDSATTIQMCRNIISHAERFYDMGFFTEDDFYEVKDYVLVKVAFLEGAKNEKKC